MSTVSQAVPPHGGGDGEPNPDLMSPAVEQALISRLPLPRTSSTSQLRSLRPPASSPPRSRREQQQRPASSQPTATSTAPSSPPPPTIRILAVADIDLRSAARLAEYALKEREDIVRTELGGRRRTRRSRAAGAGSTAAGHTERGNDDGDDNDNDDDDDDGRNNECVDDGSSAHDNGSSSSDNNVSDDASLSSDEEDSVDTLSLGAYEIRTRPLGGGSIDLCVACGPFVHSNHRSARSGGGGGGGGGGTSSFAGGAFHGSSSVGSSSSCSCSCSCSESGSFENDGKSNNGNNIDEDEEDDDDDSSSSSGTGGYDNTGGFGYREVNSSSGSNANVNTGRNRRSEQQQQQQQQQPHPQPHPQPQPQPQLRRQRFGDGLPGRNAHNNIHLFHGHRSNRSTPHLQRHPHICARHLEQQRYPSLVDMMGRPNAEQDAADEGVITSTLSQLENIVCRVLYVPGQGDPPSLFGRHSARRGGVGGGSGTMADDWDDMYDSEDNNNGNGGEGGHNTDRQVEGQQQQAQSTADGGGQVTSRTQRNSIPLLHRDSLSTAHVQGMHRSDMAISSVTRHHDTSSNGAGAAAGGSSPRIMENEEINDGDFTGLRTRAGTTSRTSVADRRRLIEKARRLSPYGNLITEAELAPHKRLTPNSRNVHRRWVQLGPGLGVAGLARDVRPARLSGGGDDTSGRVHQRGGKHADRTVLFDQNRYVRTLGSLLSLAPPSRSFSMSSSKIFTCKPSQAIVLTNLPGENERNTRAGVIAGKRRGKRDKDVRPQTNIADNSSGEEGIPIAYRDLLSTATGDGEGENQVLLKLASPPQQKRHHHGSRHLGGASRSDMDQPREFETDGVKLVMPGSLRKSGEFALIDVALCRDDKEKSTTSSTSTDGAAGTYPNPLVPPSHRWRVNRVQFRSMDERGR